MVDGTHKYLESGECVAPQRLLWTGWSELRSWYSLIIHPSWMAQVSGTCFLTESLTAANCRMFILDSIFWTDYLQESWVSSNNCRCTYLFAGHSSFAVLFNCASQAKKFMCMTKAGLPWWANIHLPQALHSAVTIALTLSSIRTISCGRKEFKGEGLIISLQLGD